MHLENHEWQAIAEYMKEACNKLMELGCDSVQIVTSGMVQGNNCARGSWGAGNLFARYGSVDEWLREQKDMQIANEIAIATKNNNNNG